MHTFFLVTIALTPGIAIAIYMYTHDKHEPEPIQLLLLSFFYGALSLGVNLAIALPVDSLIHISEKNLTNQAVYAFGVVAFLEEFSKFIFVRGILYRNNNFNEPLDGIVYSVMVGMGFATAENIIYVLQGGGGTAIVRMFSAIPAHALFAVLMGYWLGKAKFTNTREFYYGTVALVVATLFHGIYDYFLFISFVPGIWVWSFVSLIIAFALARKAVRLHQAASPFIDTKKETQEIVIKPD
ncbi:MAG: PrsW family intramembrane metalloprotease [Cyclobacteriaceae bacterium]|nr:PrsW family intramembrane metalloprotease [Cyclobacteriaceae bacterium]UYN88377.1 MAG: PrsW family intramembrane metalloprotease [Cyclobacteriaceae bacterium]